MPKTFRAKLVFIVAAAAFALILLIATGALIAASVKTQVALIQERYVPKLELGPKLEGQLEHLTRSLQDAVAAQDATSLAESERLQVTLMAQLIAAEGALGSVETTVLRNAVQDYYVLAHEVSRRMIAGETGEDLVGSISSMQQKQVRAVELLRKAVAFDRDQLGDAFAAVSRAEGEAARIRLWVSLACLLIVTLLSAWLSRGVLQSLQELASGFERFGRGEFDHAIELASQDELAALAASANRMAGSLLHLNRERDQSDWLKAGHAQLVHELRGELDMNEVADRALRVLARYLEAPAAALYYLAPNGAFERVGSYALPDAVSGKHSAYRPGEGLVGEAARGQDITLITQLPDDYLRLESGVGAGVPRAVALIPMLHLGHTTGVLELALLRAWAPQHAELLLSVRETIAITLEVARARAALRALLHETQRQAERLTSQEEELRTSNEELQQQQHELRDNNQALTRQAQELDAQRVTLELKNTELDATRKVLEKNAAELTTVSAYKTQFLANMSHELRTPLNSMLLLSNLLADNEGGNLNAKQVEFCRTIHGAGRDLLALINQVLDLAKIEAGKQQVLIETVPLQRLVQYARRVFEPVARDKHVEFSAELAPGCPEQITTDPQRVEQILNNLLGNALKFTERGRVTLRIAPAAHNAPMRRTDLLPGQTLVLSVSDTGIGIAPAHQERIFAPFEQADVRQDRRFGGTGLGLTIARDLATLLGGELQLTSALGQGSTFVCYLPHTLAAPISQDARTDSEPPAYSDARTLGRGAPAADSGTHAQPDLAAAQSRHEPTRGRLLMVEDDAHMAMSLRELLRTQQVDVEVVCVSSAKQALAALRDGGFNGMVLDLGLPDMDGLELLETIKAEDPADVLPVVVYTGRALSKTELQRLDAYTEAVVLKGGAGAQRVLQEINGFTQRLKAGVRLAPRHPSLGTPATTQLRLDRRKVLVADDDMRTVYALSALLRGKGAEVLVAETGLVALQVLETHLDVDAVLLDLMMPELDGYETLQRIRSDPRWLELPVIVLTACAMKSDKQKCLEAGATDYVAKPVDGERLIELLHTWLTTHHQARRASA